MCPGRRAMASAPVRIRRTGTLCRCRRRQSWMATTVRLASQASADWFPASAHRPGSALKQPLCPTTITVRPPSAVSITDHAPRRSQWTSFTSWGMASSAPGVGAYLYSPARTAVNITSPRSHVSNAVFRRSYHGIRCLSLHKAFSSSSPPCRKAPSSDCKLWPS